ncbi:DUF3152 domain-containing protein [Streptomyces tagetis]|uniref:DUF3152 domain-containing protein n=1 Tax=Streptomyces tagetis TaxID=2820809 RepID=A0A941B872_9ACTN|nr:DUF3152 domain-containing protein [Streptomyces sp. RG38]MBQ0828208.1 DUF3152 domain-containing protein [Streptomyces sp. RG38]
MGRPPARRSRRSAVPGGGRRARAARRRRPARTALAGLALGAVLVAAGAAAGYWRQTRAGDPGGGAAGAAEAAGPKASDAKAPSTAPPPPSPSPSPPVVAVPETGPGTFTTADADGASVGTGTRVRRYMVLVEEGIDIPAEEAAAEVSAVLADPRGWTRGGTEAFRLVGSGPHDFVVRIATPGTVDEICGAAGLNTRGEVNCSVGKDVVVNLKRWVLGSPEFDGPIGEYRALIVNHEVGHRIGRGHETCPGPGLPAPAMMQQIKGLQGCVANAWPYDRDGRYLGGPSVP